jgi:hypothetical protein
MATVVEVKGQGELAAIGKGTSRAPCSTGNSSPDVSLLLAKF